MNTIFTILSRALKVNTKHVKRKQISQHLSSLHCGKNAGTVLVNRTTDDYLRRWNVINSHEPFTAFKIRTGYDMTFQQDYLLRQHFACSMFCSSGFMQHTNKRNQITKHELKIRKAFSMGEKLFLKIWRTRSNESWPMVTSQLNSWKVVRFLSVKG